MNFPNREVRRLPERLTDVAITRVKEMIASGELVPGQRLPRERDLALQLGLREVRCASGAALTLIKVLETRQGDGTYVTSLTSHLLLESLTFVTHSCAIPSCSKYGRSAGCSNPPRRLWPRAHDERTPPAAQGAPGSLCDSDDGRGDDAGRRRVHRYVNASSGNSLLASVIETLSVRTLRVRAWRKSTDEAHWNAAFDEHLPIYRAILARDPELAHAAAATHVAEGETWLRRSLEQGMLEREEEAATTA